VAVRWHYTTRSLSPASRGPTARADELQRKLLQRHLPCRLARRLRRCVEGLVHRHDDPERPRRQHNAPCGCDAAAAIRPDDSGPAGRKSTKPPAGLPANQLRRTSFTGYDAVRWEFLMTESGVSLHKLDTFFMTNNGNGYAILLIGRRTRQPARSLRRARSRTPKFSLGRRLGPASCKCAAK
jgi:hypothetical protein